jgi:hypothetical protein
MREEQLTLHEEGLVVREVGIEAMEWVIRVANIVLDTEWVKVEAT